jgi:hypothetical protein
MPYGTIFIEVQALSFQGVRFYSIINHLLQATWKCFAVVQLTFQVLVITNMLLISTNNLEIKHPTGVSINRASLSEGTT